MVSTSPAAGHYLAPSTHPWTSREAKGVAPELADPIL
jgi:hypothetical protein